MGKGPLLWGPNNTSNNLQNKIKLATNSQLTVGLSTWVTGTIYNQYDVLEYGSNVYSALVTHTSGATFEADVALGYWVLLNTPVLARNYMTVGYNFEDGDTGGWQLFTIAGYTAGSVPSVAPTIGSAASMTVAATSTNPLSGKYSLQVSNVASTNFTAGQGIISQAYSIDIIDQARALGTKFAYQATTGASYQNYSGTSSNTWAMYILDYTGGSYVSWIQPAGVYNLVQNSGVGLSTGTWQTPATMTQFRIALVCINTTTGSSPAVNTIRTTFDDFYVGQQVSAIGPAMNDLTAYTATLNNFGNGTAALAWKRSGNMCKIKGELIVGSSLPTGVIVFYLPTGLTADYTNIPKGVTGSDAFQRVGLATSYAPGYFTGAIIRNGTALTSFYVNGDSTSYGSSGDWDATHPTTWTAGDVITIDMEVPIVGWSSNTINSADFQGTQVALEIGAASVSSTLATNTNCFPSPTVSIDTAGSFVSQANSYYKIPSSGIYSLGASVILNCTAYTSLATIDFFILVNGVTYLQTTRTYISGTGFYQAIPLNITANLKAGDQVQYLMSLVGGTATINVHNDAVRCNATCVKSQGSPIVQAADTVAASYGFITSGTGVPNATPTNLTSTYVTYSKSYDTTNSFNTTSGAFICPVSGKYSFSATVEFNASVTGARYVQFNQTGSTTRSKNIAFLANNIAASSSVLVGTADFSCVAGDSIVCNVSQSSGGALAIGTSGPTYNFIDIRRVGN